MTRNQEEILELLEHADDLIHQASDALNNAQELMKDEDYEYNIIGNIDGYVINYLTGGMDSISDKIQKYIEETTDLENESDEEDD
jgi:thiamine pyrophosphokinase